MALPVPVKTWQVSRNVTVGAQVDALTQARVLMKAIKDTMVAFASNAPTVAGSSNGSAAGMDAVDRWTATTSLVWNNNGSAHSWIVFAFPQINPNFQVCIDLNSNATWFASWVVSWNAGFTGGSTTARPTATDEAVFLNTTDWYSNVLSQYQVHMWMSSDGQGFRMCVWRNAACTNFWLFEKPRIPRTGWSNPAVAMMRFGDMSHNAFFASPGSGLLRGRHGATTMVIACTGESANGGLLATLAPFSTQQNDIDSAWDFYPMGLISQTVAGTGRHGMLHDMWFAPNNLGNADTAPNDANDRRFVKLGGLWLPWHPGGSTIALLT